MDADGKRVGKEGVGRKRNIPRYKRARILAEAEIVTSKATSRPHVSSFVYRAFLVVHRWLKSTAPSLLYFAPHFLYITPIFHRKWYVFMLFSEFLNSNILREMSIRLLIASSIYYVFLYTII
jgi:hypothetical protein